MCFNSCNEIPREHAGLSQWISGWCFRHKHYSCSCIRSEFKQCLATNEHHIIDNTPPTSEGVDALTIFVALQINGRILKSGSIA